MRHSSFLEVHLNRLDHNYNLVQKLSGKSSIIPMVKANGYGHGLTEISQFLYDEKKCTYLGVASLGEGKELALSLEDFRGKIIIFSDTEIQDSKLNRWYLDLPLIPVLHQLEDVQVVLQNPDFKFLPLFLKLDTGMNRLGIRKNEWQAVADLLKKNQRKEITHLMTHFSVSFHPLKANDKTHRQMQEFQEAVKFFKDNGIEVKETSVANSGAIEQKFGVEENFVRPGLMLYGAPSVIYPNGSFENLKIISNLTTKVLKKFKATRGTPIGYGVNVLHQDATILVLPLGYGDGLFTFWSGVEFQLKNYKAKIFGRVNMDMCFIECPIEAYDSFEVGENIDLWNEDPQYLTDLCSQIKTIPYQLFCAVNSRVPRIYRLKS